jgi:hypothetical protein
MRFSKVDQLPVIDTSSTNENHAVGGVVGFDAGIKGHILPTLLPKKMDSDHGWGVIFGVWE